jgi:hypothetical protein
MRMDVGRRRWGGSRRGKPSADIFAALASGRTQPNPGSDWVRDEGEAVTSQTLQFHRCRSRNTVKH